MSSEFCEVYNVVIFRLIFFVKFGAVQNHSFEFNVRISLNASLLSHFSSVLIFQEYKQAPSKIGDHHQDLLEMHKESFFFSEMRFEAEDYIGSSMNSISGPAWTEKKIEKLRNTVVYYVLDLTIE